MATIAVVVFDLKTGSAEGKKGDIRLARDLRELGLKLHVQFKLRCRRHYQKRGGGRRQCGAE